MNHWQHKNSTLASIETFALEDQPPCDALLLELHYVSRETLNINQHQGLRIVDDERCGQNDSKNRAIALNIRAFPVRIRNE